MTAVLIAQIQGIVLRLALEWALLQATRLENRWLKKLDLVEHRRALLQKHLDEHEVDEHGKT